MNNYPGKYETAAQSGQEAAIFHMRLPCKRVPFVLHNQGSRDIYELDHYLHNKLSTPLVGAGSPYYSCVEQTDYVVGAIKDKFPQWDFKVISLPWHTHCVGVPRIKNLPNLVIDPLFYTFTEQPP